MENTAKRLQKYMELNNLRQVDLLEMIEPYAKKHEENIQKSHLSQWVAGKHEPDQNKLYVMSEALNVNPAWLMGYDVEMNKDNKFTDANNLSIDELSLLRNFNNTNKQGRDKILNYSNDIAKFYPYVPSREEMLDFLSNIQLAAYDGNMNIYKMNDEKLFNLYSEIRKEIEND